MSRWVLAVVAGASLLGVVLLTATAWYVALPFFATAAWLIAVERSVGVARFARFDPRPPRTRRGRRQRAALITVALVACVALGVLIGLKHPDPPAVAAGCCVLLAPYTWWAIGLIKSHDVERVIRANAPE